MTKTTKKTSTKTATKRMPKGAAKVLTSLEENVVRMRHGLNEPGESELGTKAVTPELAEILFAIEARAYEMTGRAAASSSKKPSPKAKIVSALKTRS
ncbi:MAG: hypothetical protein ABIJ09_06990 [Pseudomonadota bacterium]